MPEKYNSAVIGCYAKEKVELKALSQESGKSNNILGMPLFSQLLYSAAAAKTPSNPSGNGSYRISIMKGQFVFVAETNS